MRVAPEMSGSATTAESAATGIRDQEMSETSHDVLLGGVAPDAYEETVEEASRRLNVQLRRNDNNEEQRHIKYYSDVYPVGVQTPYVKSMFYHAAWDVVDCLVFGAWAVSYWPHVDTRSQTEFGIITGLVFCFCLLACVLGFLYEMVHRTTNINESTRIEVFTTGSVVYPTIWWFRDSFEDGVSAQSYARLELVVDFFCTFLYVEEYPPHGCRAVWENCHGLPECTDNSDRCLPAQGSCNPSKNIWIREALAASRVTEPSADKSSESTHVQLGEVALRWLSYTSPTLFNFTWDGSCRK